MKKKVVLKGRICDVCGRLIKGFDVVPYDDPHTGSRHVGEKTLKIRMEPSLFCLPDDVFIEKQTLNICGQCADDLRRRFVAWKMEREEKGKAERERILAKLYE